MISSLELAKLCKVSQGTVDRALHNRKGISKKTREKILEIAKTHGYAPNPAARELITGKSSIVGAAIPQMNSIFFMDLFTEIKEHLRAIGYRFVLAPFADEAELLEILADFSARRYCAAVVVPTQDNMSIPDQLAANMKILSVIAPVQGKNSQFITPDEVATGSLAAEFMAKQGHHNIIHLTYTRNSHAILARTKGFTDKAAELKLHVSVLKELDAEKLLSLIKQHKASAIFCHNDWLALETLRIIEREGIKVPDEISILGVDNSPTFNSLNSDITTIQYPHQWVGKQIAAIINGKKTALKTPILKVIKKRS
ncbi:MAG: LacI family transcriptional regulator [Victivallaceae bacterium]|nr:LacI family transcriptional regulator [Victivallaceae bacterium]